MSDDNVKVVVGGDVSQANAALDAAERKAAETGRSMEEKFGIKGLKGEGKLHRQLDGIFKDAKNAGSGFDLAGMAVQRLAGSFRLALPAMIAFTIAIELFKSIKEAIDGARERAEAFRETMREMDSENIATASLEQLDEIDKKLRDMEQKYEGRNWFIKLLDIDGNKAAKKTEEALNQVEAQRVARMDVQAETRNQASSADPQLQLQARISKVSDEHAKNREALRKKGASASAIAADFEDEHNEIAKLNKEFADAQFEVQTKAAEKAEEAWRKGTAEIIGLQEDLLKSEAEKLKKAADLNAEAAAERTRRMEDAKTKEEQIRDVRSQIIETNKAVRYEVDPVKKAEAHLELEKLLTKEARLQAEIQEEKNAQRQKEINEANALAKAIKDAEKEANTPSKLHLTEQEWRARRASSVSSGKTFAFGAFGQGLAERAHGAGAGVNDAVITAQQQRGAQLTQLQIMREELRALNMKLVGTA